MSFDEWAKENENKWWELFDKDCKATCNAAWDYQQAKIDAALEFTENVHDENWQEAINCIKELLK